MTALIGAEASLLAIAGGWQNMDGGYFARYGFKWASARKRGPFAYHCFGRREAVMQAERYVTFSETFAVTKSSIDTCSEREQPSVMHDPPR